MDDPALVVAWLKVAAVVGAITAMLYGLNRVYCRLKAKNQGFGPNSLRGMGIVMFLPTLLMLSLLTNFQTETLAAILGTVAGYVLSNSRPED